MKPGNNQNFKRSAIFVVATALGSFAPSAFAYLDPSTGSMILSAIVGLFATVGLAVKTYWYKLKSLLGRNKSVSVDMDFTAANDEAGNNTDASFSGT